MVLLQKIRTQAVRLWKSRVGVSEAADEGGRTMPSHKSCALAGMSDLGTITRRVSDPGF